MAGRLRWLVVFTLLLLASTAVPVFAQSEPSSTIGEEAVPPPDPLAVQAALEEAEREEAAHERWLESPEAEREREESRLAFADLGAAEVKELLREHFGEQLAFLNREDPARVISDAVVRDVYPGEGATIELGGQELLLDGAFPTHAEDENGELAKVDLELQATAEGFELKSPLVELSIADSASGPVEAAEGEEEIAITALGGSDSAAQRFGDKDVLYPEVREDTDRLVSPISSGLEIFELLRSEDSPETFRYRLDLPQGATLQIAGEGAEITSEGETLMRVRPPVAIDAQGSDVPVTMEVEGDVLVLNVPHRGMGFAPPIALDPVFEWEIQEDWYSQNWYQGYHLNDLYQWDYYTNSSWIYGQTYTINHNFGGSGRGLHVSSRPGDFGPGKWGHWAYDLPNLNAYVEAISVLPFKYKNHDCQKYYHQQPDDYVGLWDASQSKWIALRYNDSYYKGYSNIGFPEENPGWGHMAMIGLSMGPGPNMPCWRDFYAGGALVYLSDWADPEIANVAGIPGGWIGDGSNFTITANAYDAGLGVREAAFNPEGQPTLTDDADCSGLAGDRCPTSFAAQRKFTEDDLDQGRKWLRASAIDALGRGSQTITAWTKVDRTPPEVTLSGQLAQATNEGGDGEQPPGEGDELTLPVYRLNIDATDGSNAENATKRSGVKDIRVYLDGVEQEVPWSAQSCPQDSCPMNVTYELRLHDVSAGKHTLEVNTEDQVGKVRYRDVEFEYFPATGMKDSYVMHYFPLPDGEGNEDEEEHPKRPELAVNVMNGNLVYRERDVDVEGPAVDLEVERYYNSMLPESENTEWGDGWTLAQTPELEPEVEEGDGQAPPSEARLREASGALDGEVELPTQVGAESFDSELQATITRDGDGYVLTDETGESATSVVFDEDGRTEELRTGEGTPGEATVDYTYEGGELAGIAVDDPGSAGSPTEEPEEAEGEPAEPDQLHLAHSGALGSTGSGEGQLEAPGDVAVGPEGDLWVADTGNHRIEHFSPEGDFIAAFGSNGSGDGQLKEPSGIAVGPEGDLWVADTGNHRIQHFDPEGQFLGKFGALGFAEGKLLGPDRVAIDAAGDVWVADTSKVQRFGPGGEFVERVGTSGTAPGQIKRPEGIEPAADGKVWIADSENDRISAFEEDGDFLAQFGSHGSGEGQFEQPVDVAVDSQGNLWVADADSDRVQMLDPSGEFVAQFGASGSGEEQLNLSNRSGLVSDGGGNLWIADAGNDRIQQWLGFEYGLGEEAPTEDDPAVEVETSEGLISSVEGEEAGAHSYEHEGDLLTAHEGPQGETAYEYDEAGRLTKVTLPNGTWGEVAYDAADGRVSKVTVKPAGEEAKTTFFDFYDEPRRTVVDPPDAPHVTYDIGPDGSVLKWWNAEAPPEFDDLAGTLYSQYVQDPSEPLGHGAQNLITQAYSEEGIASIEVIAEGDTLVDEMTCEQTEEPGIECETLLNEWVTDTGLHARGRLDLEVIITDSIGNSAAEKLWVTIPKPPPPPPPGAQVAPKFHDILEFREEYGLEVVFPVKDELALHDRIFNLIGAWYNPHTPEGKVARASMARWGVPLRQVDVAELEYRIAYQQQMASEIREWAATHASGSYADFYVEESHGGLIYIGFTGNQATQISALKTGTNLMSPDRLAPFSSVPQSSLSDLEELEAQINAIADAKPELPITTTSIDSKANTVSVGAGNVQQVDSYLHAELGSSAPFSVTYDVTSPGPRAGREQSAGPIRAGDRFTDDWMPLGAYCTSGFGAFDIGHHPSNGARVERTFMLTAGHCGRDLYIARRRGEPGGDAPRIGYTSRRGYDGNPQTVDTDISAIRLDTRLLTPRYIYTDGTPIPVQGIVEPYRGMIVCQSGVRSGQVGKDVRCGKITRMSVRIEYDNQRFYQIAYDEVALRGDSGGPVWQKGTRNAVGIVTAGEEDSEETEIAPSYFTPLLPIAGRPHIPGAFGDPELIPLHLFTAN